MVKCVNIDLLEVKPNYIVDEIISLKEFDVFPKKHEFPCPKFFLTESGGGSEIVGISTWDSMDCRSVAMDKLLTDVDYIKFAQSKSKYVRTMHNFVCTSMDHLFPQQPINPTSKYFLETFSLKGFPMTSAVKFKELFNEMKKNLVLAVPDPTMMLMPMLGEHTDMFLLIEIPDGKIDPIYEGMIKQMQVPENISIMEEAHKYCTRTSTKILKPIDFDKMPDPTKCKIQ